MKDTSTDTLSLPHLETIDCQRMGLPVCTIIFGSLFVIGLIACCGVVSYVLQRHKEETEKHVEEKKDGLAEALVRRDPEPPRSPLGKIEISVDYDELA
ncbi:unnamed protein product, partial [Mesorhabditis spiculigera]